MKVVGVFGMGIERICGSIYVNDIRLFYSGDIRFWISLDIIFLDWLKSFIDFEEFQKSWLNFIYYWIRS